MAAKAVLIFCAQAIFIQTALSQQCTSRAAIDASRLSSPYGMAVYPQASPARTYDRLHAPGIPYNGRTVLSRDGFYSPAKDFGISSGGGLPVTSISSISPTGITVKSDNSFEGALTVIGELPFVSVVAMEGNLPTAGAGATEYGCGNGLVAILSEGPASASFGPTRPGAYGPGTNVAFSAGGGFSLGPALGLGNGFGAASGTGSAAGFASTNRLGYGGCGRGMFF